jgi:hypothetical protein
MMGTVSKISLFVIIVAVVAYYFFSSMAKGKATSVVVQALYFLARPHISIDSNYQFKPIPLLNAWNGSYMTKHPELWTHVLSAEEKEEFTHAIQYFQSLNKSLESMTVDIDGSGVNEFPLSVSLQKKINDAWKFHLGPKGYGFYALRGVPVDQWSFGQSEIFYFALGKYLGTPGAQDIKGTLLGHVKSIGYTDNQERPYRQTVDIAYHCDGADVVGLLCLYPAKEGGISRIISSTAVYNRLFSRYGNEKGKLYAKKLTSEIFSSVRPTFGLGLKLIPFTPLKLDDQGVLRTFWNQEYYMKAYKHGNGSLTAVGERDPLAVEAIQAYDRILMEDMRRGYVLRGNCSDVDDDPLNDCVSMTSATDEDVLGLDMTLQRGDVQLVSNHFILHARTEFTDYSDEEIEAARKIKNIQGKWSSSLGKRELFRLWLSQSTSHLTWDQYLSKQNDLLKVFGSLMRGLVFYS